MIDSLPLPRQHVTVLTWNWATVEATRLGLAAVPLTDWPVALVSTDDAGRPHRFTRGRRPVVRRGAAIVMPYLSEDATYTVEVTSTEECHVR